MFSTTIHFFLLHLLLETKAKVRANITSHIRRIDYISRFSNLNYLLIVSSKQYLVLSEGVSFIPPFLCTKLSCISSDLLLRGISIFNYLACQKNPSLFFDCKPTHEMLKLTSNILSNTWVYARLTPNDFPIDAKKMMHINVSSTGVLNSAHPNDTNCCTNTILLLLRFVFCVCYLYPKTIRIPVRVGFVGTRDGERKNGPGIRVYHPESPLSKNSRQRSVRTFFL